MDQEIYLLALSGELSAKGRPTRRRFVEALERNVREALRSHGLRGRLHRRWSRLLLEVDPQPGAPPSGRAPGEDPAAIVARVFGIQYVAAAVARPFAGIDDLLRDGLELFREPIRGKTFAVRLRRGEAATSIPFQSPELERRLGALLAPFAAGVDLETPEVEARIELHDDHAYYYARRVEGVGGLPVGTAGRALLLFSGGFDSAVAAYLLLRRGLRLEYLLANLGHRDHLEQVARVAEVVVKAWSHGDRPKLHVVDFRPWDAEIEARTPPPLWQVLLKRGMVRAGAIVARRRRLEALASGESLGQVSSQTLRNLATIERASDLLLLRPLLTFGKDEIVALARRVGTAQLSARVPELCGLDASAPATHARVPEVAEAEALLDPALLEELVDAREIFDLRALPEAGTWTSAGDLELDEPLPGAHLLDLRASRQPPLPNASALPWREAWQAILGGHLPVAGDVTPWILVCERGWRSAWLAELLRIRGHQAHSLRGGAAGWLRRQDPLLRATLSPVSFED
jgi:thiamine biosynthesis protein ThiI